MYLCETKSLHPSVSLNMPLIMLSHRTMEPFVFLKAIFMNLGKQLFLLVDSLFYFLQAGRKGLEAIFIFFSITYLCSVTISTPWNIRGQEGEPMSSC